MERRLKRIALLRSWFRDRNCIFKLTFARIGSKRYSAASSHSFLSSPLSLHKPGLNNKSINPVEVPANGNKPTAVIWLGVVMWFSIQPQEAELEGRERTVSQGTREKDAGWSLGACASSQGEVMWDGQAWGWLLIWGQWQRPPSELCESLWNFSDPYFPVLGWCTHGHQAPCHSMPQAGWKCWSSRHEQEPSHSIHQAATKIAEMSMWQPRMSMQNGV